MKDVILTYDAIANHTKVCINTTEDKIKDYKDMFDKAESIQQKIEIAKLINDAFNTSTKNIQASVNAAKVNSEVGESILKYSGR